MESRIKKTIALCGAHDDAALEAVADAHKKGLVDAVLIGDRDKVVQLLAEFGADPDEYEIVHMPEEKESAQYAVKLVREGKADIPMKGLMQTSSYMKAILNKETGLLPPGHILSQCSIFEYPDKGRILFISDCAVNINPDLKDKEKIIQNSVDLARVFGYEKVKVAVLSAVEKVNPKLPSSVDADDLSHIAFDHAVVEGPYALDNALSEESARHKGITGLVAGDADVLIASDLNMGNVLHKALTFFGHFSMASALCGTLNPVILTSRADSPETKYHSILTAVLQACK